MELKERRCLVKTLHIFLTLGRKLKLKTCPLRKKKKRSVDLKIKGMITALVTPFFENGDIDFESLGKLVQFQLDGGVEGFVISGTTAESPNLSNEEVSKIFRFIKDRVPLDFPLILGVGTNSTQGTIDKIKALEGLDPQAYLVVVPYYNKPSQEGLFQHFKKVAGATEKDILLYDVPGRTVVEISVDTVAKLSEIKNIVGIKDATGDLEKLKKYLSSISDKDFSYLSGDDGTTVDFVALGGHGVISVLSHILPSEFKNAMVQGDFSSYEKICNLLFVEPNPTPVKKALKLMKVIEDDFVRLPLVRMSAENADELTKELSKLGVIQ